MLEELNYTLDVLNKAKIHEKNVVHEKNVCKQSAWKEVVCSK
jgi:hypothetical protein